MEESQTRKEKHKLIPQQEIIQSLLGWGAFTQIAITLSHSLRGERSGYRFTFVESSVDITSFRYPRKVECIRYKWDCKHTKCTADMVTVQKTARLPSKNNR
jgi:hypothetical protein